VQERTRAAWLTTQAVETARRVGDDAALAVCLLASHDTIWLPGMAEYAVAPSALWRDVLPTTAHRWVVQQPSARRVLDCAPLTQESASIQWLTGSRVTMLTSAVSDCLEPNLAQKLAAHDYTHLLVRRSAAHGSLPPPSPLSDGFRLAATFADGLVFVVTAQRPMIYTSSMVGFSPREGDGEWSWRWMGTPASWTITSTAPLPLVAALDVEASAFQHDRQVAVWLDGTQVQSVVVAPSRRRYRLGPFRLERGSHELRFRSGAGAAACPGATRTRCPRAGVSPVRTTNCGGRCHPQRRPPAAVVGHR